MSQSFPPTPTTAGVSAPGGGPTFTRATAPRPAPPRVAASRRARTEALQGIRALVAALRRTARSIETRTGLTNAQVFVLQQLARSGPMSVGALAQRVETRQGAVSTMVARLAARRLVAHVRDPTDGRRVMLSVTPRARELVRRAPPPPTAALLAALDELTERDLAALAKGLVALARVMGLSLPSAALLFEDTDASRTTTRRRRGRNEA